jgi:hypothetical protein
MSRLAFQSIASTMGRSSHLPLKRQQWFAASDVRNRDYSFAANITHPVNEPAALPRLPVPSLKQTMTTFLRISAPLLTADEYKETESVSVIN